MKNWTIKTRIIFGFGLLILISGALGLYGFLSAAKLDGYSTDIATNWLPGVVYLSKIDATVKNVKSDVLENMLAEDALATKAAVDLYEKDLATASKDLKDYEQYLSLPPSPDEKPMYAKTTATFAAFKDALNTINTLSSQNKNKEAHDLYSSKGKPLLDAFLSAVDEELEWNKDHAKEVAHTSNESATFTKIGMLIGAILAVLLGTSLGYMIVTSISAALLRLTGILGESSAQVASAAGQVSSSSQSLAQGASEQAAALEETSASLEEMASLGKQNNANAVSARDRTKATLGTVETGVRDMARMGGVLTQVQGASDELAASTDAIKQASNNIAKIIKTIDEIAFQTNILALNAAVEAARAGEAGMGFAVVADEVRNLAHRSAEAAKETSRMIEDSIAKSDQGVEITAKVINHLGILSESAAKMGQRLAEVEKQVKEVDQFSNEIAGASEEQSHGIGQVNLAISNMDKVTQTNAATAEESAAAAEELTAQAEGLKEATNDLIRLVQGADAVHAAVAVKASGSWSSAPLPVSAKRLTHGAPRRPQAKIPMPGIGFTSDHEA